MSYMMTVKINTRKLDRTWMETITKIKHNSIKIRRQWDPRHRMTGPGTAIRKLVFLRGMKVLAILPISRWTLIAELLRSECPHWRQNVGMSKAPNKMKLVRGTLPRKVLLEAIVVGTRSAARTKQWQTGKWTKKFWREVSKRREKRIKTRTSSVPS